MKHQPASLFLRHALLACALTACASGVQAQTTAASSDKQPPQLTLSASAAAEVAQDKVAITLASEIEDTDQAKLSQRLNKVLQDTLSRARRESAVTARSGNYTVWPQNDQNGKIRTWRGRAEMVLESRDFAAASKLAGELSTAMPISNIAFSLSTEAREAEEKRLLDEAAKAFGARATHAAKAFGFGGYAVKQLDLSGGGVVVSPMPRGVAAMAAPAFKAGADVPLESGKSTVTVSVRGTVYLTGR